MDGGAIKSNCGGVHGNLIAVSKAVAGARAFWEMYLPVKMIYEAALSTTDVPVIPVRAKVYVTPAANSCGTNRPTH